jgi:hypothetical protein
MKVRLEVWLASDQVCDDQGFGFLGETRLSSLGDWAATQTNWTILAS